ncbi:MAG: AraC family transcriptional regulator [Candidatus Andeanibacterium colombiense]|uniref:AraC family transcriptional regulator n=1 Tax=Candidatus Andeanibacterium colombiense TaxID=3121345 RepID=A0AAJ6BMY6_9SPHN|nr:MAG: AraC family transcriptional regulator [Sphingomonadaceae bacterium]
MALLEQLSTTEVALRDRVPFWNGIAQMFAPIRVEPLGELPFEGRLYRSKLRECELLSPCSSPARIYSGPDHEQAGVLNIQLQHKGRTTTHTGGRTALVEEGDFLLFDPTKPHWQTFEQHTQAIVVRVPLAMAEERMPHLRNQVGIVMSGRHGAGALFSNFLRRAWDELEHEGGGEWIDGLSDAIWPLLDMAYAGTRPGLEPNRRDERRRALFEAVEAELTDPELDVHRLARRMAVSPRYVQMLFAELGTTPRAFIQNRRLELAARRLTREGGDVTVTDVAYDVGFNDLSSFCRAFRKRFETSPRNYRAGQRG